MEAKETGLTAKQVMELAEQGKINAIKAFLCMHRRELLRCIFLS